MTDSVERGAVAVVVTHEGRIMLQERDDMPVVGRWGGGREAGENGLQNIIRELKEELGADVPPNELEFIAEMDVLLLKSGKRCIDDTYIWRDVNNRITGCYEGRPAYFNSIADVMACEKLSPNARKTLELIVEKGLLA